MSLHTEDYIDIGKLALPLLIDSAKKLKEIMDREGMGIDDVIAMLEESRESLPELDFGG